jgi:hypothetical protein
MLAEEKKNNVHKIQQSLLVVINLVVGHARDIYVVGREL